MPWKRGREGKELRTYKLNKVGAKIATYHKLAIIVHVETYEIVKYGELTEMRKYLEEKYYNHPQYHNRTFRYMIYYSDNWLPDALEQMLDNSDTEFTSQLDIAYTESLFVEDPNNGYGAIYHGFTIAGDPPQEYWKEQEAKWKAVRESKERVYGGGGNISNDDDEAAEKRRLRSLKAAETMRKRREEAALKKGYEQE